MSTPTRKKFSFIEYELVNIWDGVQQNHPFGYFFKFSNFLIFHELQRASIKWFLRILNWTIPHKVIRH